MEHLILWPSHVCKILNTKILHQWEIKQHMYHSWFLLLFFQIFYIGISMGYELNKSNKACLPCLGQSSNPNPTTTRWLNNQCQLLNAAYQTLPDWVWRNKSVSMTFFEVRQRCLEEAKNVRDMFFQYVYKKFPKYVYLCFLLICQEMEWLKQELVDAKASHQFIIKGQWGGCHAQLHPLVL